MPDAIVIGAGVMGSSIAYELQKSHLDTLVLDKGEAVGGGSTSASSAVIRFNYSTHAGVTAAWESRQRWLSWAEHLGLEENHQEPLAKFHKTGMLFLEPPDFPRSIFLDLLDEFNIPYESYNTEELAKKFPSLDLGRFWPPRLPDDDNFFNDPGDNLNGWITPDAGFIDDPQLAAVNLMDAAKRNGATLRLHSQVEAILKKDGIVSGVSLKDGTTINAPIVVNAAGPWSSALNRIAGVESEMAITTSPMRQEVHAAEAPNDFNFDSGAPLLTDLDLGYYAVPKMGGTFYVGGVEPDCDPLEWVDDPDGVSLNPTVSRFEAQVWRLARRVPELGIPTRPLGIAGVYDVTPDWVPVYDRTSLPGFYVAIGTSGNQCKNAPLVGEIMREIISASENGHDHDTDPLTIKCSHTGLDLDLSAFSRNREEFSTTGSVLG